MPNLRPLLPWLTLSAPMLLMLAVVMLACGSEAGVFSTFRDYRPEHPDLTVFFTQLSRWGNLCFYAWFLFVLIKSLRKRDRATTRFVLIYIAVQLLISLLLVRVLKMTIARPRPGEDPYPPGFTTKPSYHSMPSGHTTEAVTSGLSLAGRSRQWLVHLGLGFAVAMIGFSRIYLGWHHPSDVFCGWLLGSVAGMAVTLFAGPARHGTAEPEQTDGADQ